MGVGRIMRAALIAAAGAVGLPAVAGAEETTLYASGALRVFWDGEGHLACTGCRSEDRPGQPRGDQGRAVISKELSSAYSLSGTLGHVLLLSGNGYGRCPVGDWYALNLETLRVSQVPTKGCSDIRRVELSSQHPVVTVTLTNQEGQKTTTAVR